MSFKPETIQVNLRRIFGLVLRLFVFASLDPEEVSSTKAELIAGDLHLLASTHPLVGEVTLHVGAVSGAFVGLETVTLPFLHINSRLGLLGAGDTRGS